MSDRVPLEAYVDSRELARLMGVSTRTIKRLTAAGMPSEDWGLGHCRRYRPSEAIAWARERARAGAAHDIIGGVRPGGAATPVRDTLNTKDRSSHG
jgi:phage terminase Nu1 subunit (DNA packaging protein)